MSKRKNLKICLVVLIMLTGMGSTIAAGRTQSLSPVAFLSGGVNFRLPEFSNVPICVYWLPARSVNSWILQGGKKVFGHQFVIKFPCIEQVVGLAGYILDGEDTCYLLPLHRLPGSGIEYQENGGTISETVVESHPSAGAVVWPDAAPPFKS